MKTPSTVTESSLVLGPGALPPAHIVRCGLSASPDPLIPLNFYSGVGGHTLRFLKCEFHSDAESEKPQLPALASKQAAAASFPTW